MAPSRSLLLVVCLLCCSNSLPAADSLFFVFLNTNPHRPTLSEDSVKALQAGHIANIIRLNEIGKLLVAGPFHGGGGMFIMRMGSAAEVWDSLETDPAVRANRFRLEVFPMSMGYGGVCNAIEPAEMATYAFLRHEWGTMDTSSLGGVDSLLAVINFGEEQGGVILLRTGEEEKARDLLSMVISTRPEGSYTLRKLWVGKGSFCEE